MRWVEVKGKRYQTFVDVHQAFRLQIVSHNDGFVVRANFLVTVEMFPNNSDKRQGACYEDIAYCKTEKQARVIVLDLMQPFFPEGDKDVKQ